MNTKQFFAGSALSLLSGSTRLPLGLRPVFSPDENQGGGGGGGDSGANANNQQGNNQPGGTESSTGNNAGEKFDPAAFWKEPEPAKPASPAGGSPESGGAGTGQQGQQENYGKELIDRIGGMAFGDDVFTKETAEAIASGDLTGINKAIQTQMRNVVQQTLVMAAQLMQRNNTHLQEKFQDMLGEGFTNRDNSDALETAFPMAKDPAMRPMVKGVFDQALKLSKGDRQAAIESTRSMLRYMGNKGSVDFGFETPPEAPGGNMNSPDVRSVVDDILGRK